jgi:Spy/CpxP family protein refolding chaperone
MFACAALGLPGEGKGRRGVASPCSKEFLMRSLWGAVTVAVAFVAYGSFPLDRARADEPTTGSLRERMQDLTLTDEQEAKIADIQKDYRPKVQEAAKDLDTAVKEELGKARDVLTDEQKAKLTDVKEERKERRPERLAERLAHLEQLDLTGGERAKIAEIRDEYRPKIAKAMESMRGVLTDDQKKAREEALEAGKKRREVLAAVNLTDEQKGKVEAAGKEMRTLVREELEKIRDVLSDGQKEKLEVFQEERKEHVRDRMAHAIMNSKDLDLTADQKTKLADIRKEYRPKVHEAGNKLRAAVREEVRAILAVLKG